MTTRTETRTGFGLDIHPFVEHEENISLQRRRVHLCGITIPFDKRLQGHSDADAGLHALVDAILGALGEGDIGQHFPDDDPHWKGADSNRFLLHAFEMVNQRGGRIVNIDITLLAEAPHISPHRQAMKDHLAALLKISPDRVNIKATTAEKLGFIGRKEGIAAFATASIELPFVG